MAPEPARPAIPAEDVERLVAHRLGAVHARQRLGIESETDQRIFGGGLNFFHPENWYSAHRLIAYLLKLSGFYWVGRRNTLRLRVREHEVPLAGLPKAFDGYRLLQLSDLHADLYPPAMHAVAATVASLAYDVAVITGDYRAQTYGPIDAALTHMATVLDALARPAYGVFGNHDSIRMLPGLEALGLEMLVNEHVELRRGDATVFLVGIDDAHYYRVDNVAQAAAAVPAGAVSILLSHTPEIYRQAAHAGFDLMLCGHTHGGQICLPGEHAITLDARCPRYMGNGPWRYQGMRGYTSVGSGSCIVPVRLNCPPEVTLHTLRSA